MMNSRYYCLDLKDYPPRGSMFFEGRVSDDKIRMSHDLFRGLVRLDRPIDLRANAGRGTADIMGGAFKPFILSGRVVDAFRSGGLTGWDTFPVRLFDRKGAAVPGSYWGMAVSGRGGPLDGACVTKWISGENGAKMPLSMKGIAFDEREYDGSDLFLLDDMYLIMVTERVVEALTNLKAKGWMATPIEDYRS